VLGANDPDSKIDWDNLDYNAFMTGVDFEGKSD
jgi:hypothetical protein